MSRPWFTKLRKVYTPFKNRKSDRQYLLDVEVDEMSDPEEDLVVVNKFKVNLFGHTRPVCAENPSATYHSTRQFIKKYLLSRPGKDHVPSNVTEHAKFWKLFDNPNSTSAEIMACRYILEYRFNKMTIAEQLMYAVGVSRPRQCFRGIYPQYFCVEGLEEYVYDDDTRIQKWEIIFSMVSSSNIFGPPLEEQGRPWDKPERYIAAGFFFMAFDLDFIQDKLAAMVSIAKSNDDPAVMRVVRPEKSCAQGTRTSLAYGQKSESNSSQDTFSFCNEDWPALSDEK